MEVRGKHAVIAVSLTLLDTLALVRYWRAIWEVFGGIIWAHILLVLLLALLITSLLRAWYRAWRAFQTFARILSATASVQPIVLTRVPQGETDV